MPAPWNLPPSWDARKFATRYGLKNDLQAEFYTLDGKLFLRDGVTIPDDPPIFEPPDPFVPQPTIFDLIIKLDKLQSDVDGIKDGNIKLPK